MPSFHDHADFELKARDHRRNEVSRACKICMLSQGIIAVLISNAGKLSMPLCQPSIPCCQQLLTAHTLMQHMQGRSDPACHLHRKYACVHVPLCCSKQPLPAVIARLPRPRQTLCKCSVTRQMAGS